jgi:hypothetical protein
MLITAFSDNRQPNLPQKIILTTMIIGSGFVSTPGDIGRLVDHFPGEILQLCVTHRTAFPVVFFELVDKLPVFERLGERCAQ